MLSILIPVYQFDVRQLVLSLHKQGLELNVPFEIRVYDDASPGQKHRVNRELTGISHVIYQERSTNLGRAGIRNLLAKDSSYDYLLFLDGDSEVVHPSFLERYLQAADAKAVIHGGTTYAQFPPTQPEAYLRWYYGRHREVRRPEQRKATGYHGFTSNNFLIPRVIFLQIQFDETISGYGHEDTLFGFALAKAEVPVQYIDNPLKHIGLESGSIFLKKTQEGVRNLRRLYENGKPVETKLLTLYLRIKKWGLTNWVKTIGGWVLPLMEKQLRSTHPKLWVLDFYKLVIICGGGNERESKRIKSGGK